ncbi:hypothetical protein TcWFU_005386 [Taenia crassiceps]|uniref:Uncharacterized protein n=1 Tax=Taenia crassiceps TaxID=6207 RepID=A0ABR4QR61_9CEST
MIDRFGEICSIGTNTGRYSGFLRCINLPAHGHSIVVVRQVDQGLLKRHYVILCKWLNSNSSKILSN